MGSDHYSRALEGAPEEDEGSLGMAHSLKSRMRSREASLPCDPRMSMMTAAKPDVVAAETDSMVALAPAEDMVQTDTTWSKMLARRVPYVLDRDTRRCPRLDRHQNRH